MATEDGVRDIEAGVKTDFTEKMDYGSYLSLETLLSAQRPDRRGSSADHPPRLLTHRVDLAGVLLDRDNRRLEEHHTLTPHEYAQFRGALSNASGFQSHQYRAVEFILGNKNAGMLKVFDDEPAARAVLADLLETPTLYDEFLRLLARRGLAVPAGVLERDVREPWVFRPELVPVFRDIYEDAEQHWSLYEACESLVDVEDNFQYWRFRHLRTVQRTIGFKTGTGGSSGVGFLRRALDLTFFPELYAVRTEIGT